MKKEFVTFPINEKYKIVIRVTGNKQNLTCADWGIVGLNTAKKIYRVIGKDMALECFRSLAEMLTDILDNGAILHPKLTKNLGLMHNEILLDRRKDVSYVAKGKKYRVGSYHFWSTPRSNATWLYAKDGKIFLEITPTYPWIFAKPTKNEKFYSFDEFVKNYKSILIFEIDKETARAWQKQAQEIVDTILKNHEKYCMRKEKFVEEQE